MQLSGRKRGWITIIIALSLVLLLTAPVHAFTEMTDSELSEVYAKGYSSFTLENDVLDPTKTTAKVLLNIETRTFTEIDSLKMGYYDNVGDGTGFGWDQDWTDVSLGNATTDLVCKGLFIEAKFSNITDPATRTLDYIKVGTPSMTGPISATFNSFSGHIENPTDGVLIVDAHRVNLGARTITSTNSEFYLQLSTSGPQTGWYVSWNNATITPFP